MVWIFCHDKVRIPLSRISVFPRHAPFLGKNMGVGFQGSFEFPTGDPPPGILFYY